MKTRIIALVLLGFVALGMYFYAHSNPNQTLAHRYLVQSDFNLYNHRGVSQQPSNSQDALFLKAYTLEQEGKHFRTYF